MEFLVQHSSYLYIFLGLIVLGLVLYLAYILFKLKKQSDSFEEAKHYLNKKNQERHEYRIDSIETICLATIQGQCDLSEACIRVKKLLEYYPQIASQEKYLVFEKMYQEVKVFDTHEDRQALSKQEKFKQDNRRFRIEDEYKDDLMEGLKRLKKEMEDLKGSHYNDPSHQ